MRVWAWARVRARARVRVRARVSRARVDAREPRVGGERGHCGVQRGVDEHGERAAEHDDAHRAGHLVRLRVDDRLRRRHRTATAWGDAHVATVRGTYGTAEAGTRTQHVQYVAPLGDL